jgi:hypothetical protein
VIRICYNPPIFHLGQLIENFKSVSIVGELQLVVFQNVYIQLSRKAVKFTSPYVPKYLSCINNSIMKLNEIFNVTPEQLGTKYYRSSFTWDDTHKHGVDHRTQVLMPGHLQIDPDTIVNLDLNGQIVKTDTWENMIEWLRGNWSSLSGFYRITHGNRVLHRFRISN